MPLHLTTTTSPPEEFGALYVPTVLAIAGVVLLGAAPDTSDISTTNYREEPDVAAGFPSHV